MSQEDLDLQTLLPEIVRIARTAGDKVLEIYGDRDRWQVQTKEDRSPLTAADLASHRVIAAGLEKLVPDIPVLSEEAKEIPYEQRRGWRRLFVVDPIDGTKEFLKRNGEFTVNIALVEDCQPVLGVVHAPAMNRTYYGARGLGAQRRDGDAPAQTMQAMSDDSPDLVVVASRSHPSPQLGAFLSSLPKYHLTSMGSSLKLCLVAEGAADIYPRLGPTMEWDTAAAQAVVEAAGGQVITRNGQPLAYNREQLLNPHFLVLGRQPVPWQEAWTAADAATAGN